MKENIIPHQYKVTINDRREANQNNSFLVWFTGLSGSGKSTIANGLEHELHKKGVRTYVLDGDNVRNGLNKDLSFSPQDRSENIRRIAEVSNLMIDAGLVVIAAFISPYKKDRENVKAIVGKDNIIEVYVNTSIEECEKRDVKGLYKKARSGEIKNMTGISAPYEEPENPDVIVNTEEDSLEESIIKILKIVEVKLKNQ